MPKAFETVRFVPAVVAGAILVLVGGCSPPQVESVHRELLLGLVTATSAKDPNLLSETERLIADERAAGRLSKSSDGAFSEILASGRAGDWERASRLAFALRDAQEPTEADLARLRRREMPKPKLPPKRK